MRAAVENWGTIRVFCRRTGGTGDDCCLYCIDHPLRRRKAVLLAVQEHERAFMNAFLPTFMYKIRHSGCPGIVWCINRGLFCHDSP
jgi:hypothetical protein